MCIKESYFSKELCSFLFAEDIWKISAGEKHEALNAQKNNHHHQTKKPHTTKTTHTTQHPKIPKQSTTPPQLESSAFIFIFHGEK